MPNVLHIEVFIVGAFITFNINNANIIFALIYSKCKYYINLYVIFATLTIVLNWSEELFKWSHWSSVSVVCMLYSCIPSFSICFHEINYLCSWNLCSFMFMHLYLCSWNKTIHGKQKQCHNNVGLRCGD